MAPGREWMRARVRAGESCRPGAWTNRIHARDAARMRAHLACGGIPSASAWTMRRPATAKPWRGRRRTWACPHRRKTRDSHRAGWRGLAKRRLSNRRLRDSGFPPDHPDFRAGSAGLTPDGGRSD